MKICKKNKKNVDVTIKVCKNFRFKKKFSIIFENHGIFIFWPIRK